MPDNYVADLVYGGDSTALMATLARAMGINDEFSKQLVEAANAPDPASYPASLVSSVTEGVALRTLFIDREVEDATVSGIQQVVVLGAGLDTRPWRMSWPAGVRVWHIDHAETVDFAAAVLGQPASVQYVELACDLTVGDWPSRLRASGLDEGEPVVFVAEALLLYLCPEMAIRVAQDAGSLGTAGSRFVFTYLGASNTGDRIQELAGVTSDLGAGFRSAIVSPTAFLEVTDWSVLRSHTYGQFASLAGQKWRSDEAGGVSWLAVADR